MCEEVSDSMTATRRCRVRAAGVRGARGTCYGRGWQQPGQGAGNHSK